MNSCPVDWETLLDLSECQTEQGAALRLHIENCAECRAQQKALHEMLATLHSPVLNHAPPEAVTRAQNIFRDRMTSYAVPNSLLETA